MGRDGGERRRNTRGNTDFQKYSLSPFHLFATATNSQDHMIF